MVKQPFFMGLNKTETRQKVRGILQAFKINEEFTSDFISELVLQHHYYCKHAQLRPERFRMTLRKSGKYDFEGLFPGKGWHRVSWDKAITPPNTKSWLKDSLRDLIQPTMFAYKKSNSICESCGLRPSEEVDHVEPEFDVIADEAILALSENDLKEAFSYFDFWETGKFKLRIKSPAVAKFLSRHEAARLMAVCKECHVTNANIRKKQA